MEVLYTARATTKGGRNGHVASSDGIIDLELRTPKEMGGESGYSNPEQLFAAGYAACFDSAMTMLARRKRLDVEEADRRGRDRKGPCRRRIQIAGGHYGNIPGRDNR